MDYGCKGHTTAKVEDRVGDMSAEESADPTKSWNYLKIPTRIAAAHPELVDTLPPPNLASVQPGRPKTQPGGGGVNSDAVLGVVAPGTCTPGPQPAKM